MIDICCLQYDNLPVSRGMGGATLEGMTEDKCGRCGRPVDLVL